jgi:Fe2+ transport system protein FeoA
MSRRCSLLRCPNCRYQFPERSRLYDALRRLLAWVGGRLCPSPASDADSLANLAPGSTAVVVRLDPAPTDRSQRLADLGLVPGASVRLLQRHPAYVIEVGETTLAIELAVARSIAVRVAE